MTQKFSVEAHQAKVQALVEDIQAVAKDLAIPAAKLGRDTYFMHRPKTYFATKFWVPCKREAQGVEGGPFPLAPVIANHRIKGLSTYVNKDGDISGQWVKTTETREFPEEVIERILTTLPKKVKSIARIPKPKKAQDPELLAVYPLGDPHIGMLAWAAESGENFDLKIAQKLYLAGMADLIHRGPEAKHCLVLNLGDLVHFDNDSQHTTKGQHRLDVDGRSARVLETVMHIFFAIVEMALEKHERVTVDCVAGNHDQHTSIMVSIALRSHFRDNPRVNVLLDPKARHYHRFGQVLIGTTHGDKGRINELPMVMAEERAADWGSTKHRYWLHGHIHHVQRKEIGGCVIEAFRTLAPRDSWHTGQGYTAGRDTHRIVYHSKYGEISREVCNVDRLRSA